MLGDKSTLFALGSLKWRVKNLELPPTHHLVIIRYMTVEPKRKKGMQRWCAAVSLLPLSPIFTLHRLLSKNLAGPLSISLLLFVMLLNFFSRGRWRDTAEDIRFASWFQCVHWEHGLLLQCPALATLTAPLPPGSFSTSSLPGHLPQVPSVKYFAMNCFPEHPRRWISSKFQGIDF